MSRPAAADHGATGGSAAGHGFAANLDNGQHLLLGAYTETLALMRSLGITPETALKRSPLRLVSANGQFALKAPAWLPAPLHVAAGLLTARGLAWADKRAAIRLLNVLKASGFRPAQRTVSELLTATGQTDRVIETMWRPLCLAALNTPLDDACARLFAVVLRDSLATTRADSDLLIPKVDLSALWPQAAAERCTMRYGHAVRSIRLVEDSGTRENEGRPAGMVDSGKVDSGKVDAGTVDPGKDCVEVDGLVFDQVVVAVPPVAAARLLVGLADSATLCDTLRAFTYLPIATLTVRLAGPYRLPSPMMMLFDDPASGRDGQWVFDRGALLGLPPDHAELTIVISEASALADRPRDAAINQLIQQLRDHLAAHPGRLPDLPDVTDTSLIIEKRATFAAVPDLVRPGNRTPWTAVTLAGDYTDTGYPATLEGAVRSGLAAADRVYRQIERVRDAADARN
ncbi:hydroxysqualene dehydroxylase HpnE [Pigmentiphaga litoralis]|uniref:Squalene-associated FAD-dependent desaturase n=1 Tax=Pigmentiphaga litoralis TaxID=516702 RepID=A0A7Y9IXY7_9BURK|nr:squalene-associated FAD-dependent desaturase [Pigmentiphaga litoralis]NYE84503.1 squalene-associated FAD-dependent desaturase [Pigmentiphaga litoralis]